MCLQPPLHWILIEALRDCSAHGCVSHALRRQLDAEQLIGIVALAPPLVDALRRHNPSSRPFAEPGRARLMPLERALLNALTRRSMNPFDCDGELDCWLDRSTLGLIDDSLTRLADVLRLASLGRLRSRLDDQPDAAPARTLGGASHGGRRAIKAALNR